MTREEANKELERAFDVLDHSCHMDNRRKEAFNMARMALSAEPCEDCIRRAWLKGAIHNFYYGLKHTPTEEDIQAYIDAAPSVTPKQKMGRWIPVSERLPKPFSYVNCTCHSLIDDREDWVVETFYLPQPHNSPYSDWGNIPMLNHCECKVIAWMYRDIPEPYKAESED